MIAKDSVSDRVQSLFFVQKSGLLSYNKKKILLLFLNFEKYTS